jgi:hypothetical protein
MKAKKKCRGCAQHISRNQVLAYTNKGLEAEADELDDEVVRLGKDLVAAQTRIAELEPELAATQRVLFAVCRAGKEAA